MLEKYKSKQSEDGNERTSVTSAGRLGMSSNSRLMKEVNSKTESKPVRRVDMFSSNGTRVTYKGGKGSSSGDSQKNGLVGSINTVRKSRQRSTSDKDKKVPKEETKQMFSN